MVEESRERWLGRRGRSDGSRELERGFQGVLKGTEEMRVEVRRRGGRESATKGDDSLLKDPDSPRWVSNRAQLSSSSSATSLLLYSSHFLPDQEPSPSASLLRSRVPSTRPRWRELWFVPKVRGERVFWLEGVGSDESAVDETREQGGDWRGLEGWSLLRGIRLRECLRRGGGEEKKGGGNELDSER